MAKAAGPEKVSFRQRLRQIGMVFSFTAKRDKWFLPLVIAATLLPLIAGTLLATFTGGWIWLVTGVMGALATRRGARPRFVRARGRTRGWRAAARAADRYG